jgi:flagellar hook-associated protein FlgK
MSFFGVNIAGNALSAFQNAIDVTSDNISNVNTPGASRQNALITQAPSITGPAFPTHIGQPSTQGEGSMVNQIQRIHQNSFDALFRGATSSQNFFTTEGQTLTTLQNAFGEPSNGINTAFTGLQTAAANLASQPTSIPARASVIQSAQAFVAALNQSGNAVAAAKQSTITQATSVVTQANTLIDQIAALNGQIRASTAVGDNPNTDLDQRDQDIDQLSQLVSVQTSLQSNGSALVTVNGQALVNDTVAYHLAPPVIGTNPNGTASFKIGFVNDPNPTNPTAIPLGSGQLAAFADLYNNKLTTYGTQLDAFANAAAGEIDRVTEAGLDLNGNPGTQLLQPVVQQQAISAGNIKVGITDPSQIPAGLVSTSAGTLTASLNSANNTVDTSAAIDTALTLNNPPGAAGVQGVLLVAVDGIIPVAPLAGPPAVAGVQAFSYNTAPGGNATTIDDFITNFNAAHLGVTASFDTVGQKVVFSRDPNNIDLTHRAAQGNNVATPAFTITDDTAAVAPAVGFTPNGIGLPEPVQGTPSTFLLQALGASAINGVQQNATNAYGASDNGGVNALVKLFSLPVGIGSVQSTIGAITAGAFPGVVTVQQPAPAPGFAGDFATIQVGQLLTIDAGTPNQENVTVTAVDRNNGTFTANFTKAHAAGVGGASITTAQTQTLGSAYSGLIGTMGLDLQTATTGTASQTTLSSNIDAARQAVDGINIDEETQNLIKFQNAYAAAAKTMNIMDQMLQTIITMGFATTT